MKMKKIAIGLVLIWLMISASVFSQMPLAIGSKAPDFIAKSEYGKNVRLTEVLQKGPVVLVFYRGNWCKHCNKQMSNMEDSLSMISKLGATLIAITPEDSAYVEITRKKTDASFMIIPDHGHKIMDMYKVSYKLGMMKNIAMSVMGIRIKRINDSKDRTLPVPATYIIDEDGIVRARHFDVNYTQRMSVKDIVKALQYINYRASTGKQ